MPIRFYLVTTIIVETAAAANASQVRVGKAERQFLSPSIGNSGSHPRLTNELVVAGLVPGVEEEPRSAFRLVQNAFWPYFGPAVRSSVNARLRSSMNG